MTGYFEIIADWPEFSRTARAADVNQLGTFLVGMLGERPDSIEVLSGSPHREDWFVTLWSEVRPEHQSAVHLIAVPDGRRPEGYLIWDQAQPRKVARR